VGNGASYLDHIGYYFFFVACAGVSIVVWVFNWICWYNQCCCCDFLHNPVNKRLVWWTSFIFLLGILACCISGFVTTNRFGFALEGSWCSFDRFYYDSLYGQLKSTYPKWEGFEAINDYLTNIQTFLAKIKEGTVTKDKLLKIDGSDYLEINNDYNGYFIAGYFDGLDTLPDKSKEIANQKTLPIGIKYKKIVDSINTLNKLNDILATNITSLKFFFGNLSNDFPDLKENFLEDFYYYARVARGWGKILTMIYFCLLCITVTFAGVSMMFYACLKRQGYLLTFMHVLWNIIRFFMFSYFIYGAAYGMCYLALQDSVAFVMYIFGEDNLNLNGEKSYLIPLKHGKHYLNYCLINNDNDYKNRLDPVLIMALEDYFNGYSDLKTIFSKSDSDLDGEGFNAEFSLLHKNMVNFIKTNLDKYICGNGICGELPELNKRKGGLFGFLDCSFLKSDLNMMYRTVYDLSVEARILCALSCCIGFFGAVFVYFFLLVLHHYNTEIFFDTGKSIFTGFEGYGNTKKKAINDPSYKKRKIRSEIELSSRNEEYSYKLANKNDE
jgi:hypothetical protein